MEFVKVAPEESWNIDPSILTTSRYLKNVLPASSLKISTGTMVYNIDNRLLIRAMDIGRNLFHCFWIKMWIVSKQGKNFADPIWDLSYCSCLYYQHLRYFSLFFLLGLKSPSSNPMLIGHPVFWSLIDVVRLRSSPVQVRRLLSTRRKYWEKGKFIWG